nr:hypothetical protein Iba_chr13cCG3600 [Ipomoea batatas]
MPYETHIGKLLKLKRHSCACLMQHNDSYVQPEPLWITAPKYLVQNKLEIKKTVASITERKKLVGKARVHFKKQTHKKSNRGDKRRVKCACAALWCTHTSVEILTMTQSTKTTIVPGSIPYTVPQADTRKYEKDVSNVRAKSHRVTNSAPVIPIGTILFLYCVEDEMLHSENRERKEREPFVRGSDMSRGEQARKKQGYK